MSKLPIDDRLPAENYIPKKDTWEFDAEVTRDFDAMLENSIPSYRDMRRWTDMLIERHLQDRRGDARLVDLGASRGEATARFADDGRLDALHLFEVSEPMRDILIKRYATACPRVQIHNLDLRYHHDKIAALEPTMILSVLTTVFTPISYRQAIIKAVRESLAPREGTFVWIEKILGDSPEGDEALTREYYEMKRQNGYTEDAILRKKLSLELVQVPLTNEWNEDVLHKAGFRWFQKFWQSWNFAGWIAQA